MSHSGGNIPGTYQDGPQIWSRATQMRENRASGSRIIMFNRAESGTSTNQNLKRSTNKISILLLRASLHPGQPYSNFSPGLLDYSSVHLSSVWNVGVELKSSEDSKGMSLLVYSAFTLTFRESSAPP